MSQPRVPPPAPAPGARDPESPPPAPEALRRYILYYVPAALAWIFGSDLVVAWIASDLADAIWFSVLKGTLFVAVTAWIFYAITRRVLAEWEHRNAIFRAVVEEAPDLIVRARLTPTLSFEYVSPASTALAGYTPEDFYRDPELILRAIHPADADSLRTLLSEPAPEDRVHTLRWLHRDDQSIVWTETRVSWEDDDAGRPAVAIAVVRDVTAQHEAEQSALLLATAVDAAGEAVLITDAEGVIEYVNPAFERLSGYPAAEAVGRTPRILNSGRQSESFYARLWSTLRSGGSFRGHFVNRRKDGTIYEQQTTITPVLDSGGRPTHFVAVSRDVTVEREIHRQIAASEKSAAVAQLASGMAHDFRNLLNVVLVNAELLKTACAADTEVAGHISDIQSAVAAGSSLVTGLLNIARPAGAVERRVVDLGALVADMEGLLRAAMARSVDLVLDVSDQRLPVSVDPVQIEQALLNLVRNASQAMPDGGTVTVSVDAAERHRTAKEDEAPGDTSYARLVVADTGEGMDAEALARVYDPFFTTKEAGTGLGVPMVERAVQEHDGSIRFESEVGVGTTVTIRLPLAEPEAGAPVGLEEAPPSARGPQGGSERILLVEDDDSLRRAAERTLTRLGYEVTSAANGLEAIRLIEGGERWDLLLTDLIMPGLGGAELYQRLEERDIRMPVIFMSGQAPEVIDGFAKGGGVRGFLPKPWTLQSLASNVREALDVAAE